MSNSCGSCVAWLGVRRYGSSLPLGNTSCDKHSVCPRYWNGRSSDLHRFLLHVDRYDRQEKARIFYNHVYFSAEVDPRARRALLIGRRYRAIIDRSNYSPRLIEWMTGLAGEGLSTEALSDYPTYCLRVLRNPDKLWERAFESGLSDVERIVLMCLVSLPEGVTLETLEAAFWKACAARGIDAHGKRFIVALQVLDDSFIATYRYGTSTIVTPHNLSLLDFLTGYVRASPVDAKQLLDGAAYLEQVLWTWATMSVAQGAKRMPAADATLMSAFARAFDATLDSAPADAPLGRHSISRKAVRHDSQTERLQPIVGYAEDSPLLLEQIADAWLVGRVQSWVESTFAESPTVDGLAFVGRLVGLGLLDARGTVESIKPRLLAQTDRTTRWSVISRAQQLAPKAFSVAELRDLRGELERDLEQMLGEAAAYFEDVSELADLADAAGLLGIAVDDDTYIDALQDVEAAAEGRPDVDEYEPDYDADEYREARGGGDEDRDIDAMFERLVDE